MGECAGSPYFTHVSEDDAVIILENLNGGHRTTADRLVPSCVFIDPELARVGLTESQAREKGIAYRVASVPFDSAWRAWTISERRGFMKTLVDAHSDRILGFTAFGAEAGELMGTVQLAMLAGLPYTRAARRYVCTPDDDGRVEGAVHERAAGGRIALSSSRELGMKHDEAENGRGEPERVRRPLNAADSLRRHWPEYLMEAGESESYLFSACALATLLWHPLRRSGRSSAMMPCGEC